MLKLEAMTRPRKPSMVGVFVIIAVIVALAGGYAYYAHITDVARDAKRSALTADLRRYERSRDSILKAVDGINNTYDSFFRSADVAHKADVERHDKEIRADITMELDLKLAKIEQANVKKMVAAARTLADQYDQIATVAENALGVDAVHEFRSDAQSVTTTLTTGVSEWERGVGEVVDDDQFSLAGGSSKSDDSEIESLFQQSDEKGAKFQIDLNTLASDRRQISKLIDDECRALQAQISKV